MLESPGRSGAAPLESGPLTGKQIEAYGRTGWLLARGFFESHEVAAISRWTDDLAGLPEVLGRQMVYHEPGLIHAGRRVLQRIENFCPYHPEFDGLVRASRLRAAVEQLLGAPACLFKDKVNFKMPGGTGFEPHQDQQAGWSRYASQFLTALVSIDRATAENGCLEMTDGPRFTGLIGEEWRPLSTAEMAGFKLVQVPTEPGDLLLFDSFAPHASKPNLTDAPRRILYLTYNLASEGDQRVRYFAEKRANFPPDIERQPGIEYKFKV
ncbi:MAG: 2-aminoethylphosphonate dioxygenase [Rhodospirillaceae bacterium]|nr:2-aminoethylphosphonate dioxygenase [Rhodospirillaceae bacterium]